MPLISQFFATRERNHEKMLAQQLQVELEESRNNGGRQGPERSESGFVLSSVVSSNIDHDEDHDGRHEMSEIEKTFLMPAYDVLLGTFDDYSEVK